MHDHFQKLADYIWPAAWVTWLTTHSMQVHSVLQDVALISAIFASVAAGLFHATKWVRMIRDDKQ